jgi:hypothetical protein
LKNLWLLKFGHASPNGAHKHSKQWLPGLDQDVRRPIFIVKRPADKMDEEIVADVEKKVV